MKAPDQQHAPIFGTPVPPDNGDDAGQEPVDRHLLQRLADAHGVGTSFHGWDGLPHSVAPETLTKVLAALGVPAHTNQLVEAALAETEVAPWRRMLPPAVVVQQGQTALVPVHVKDGATARLRVVLEAGAGGPVAAVQQDVWVPPQDVDGVATGRATFSVPEGLPLGWHTLHAESDGVTAEGALVVVPARLTTADSLVERRGWGLATQLYSVRSKRSWGIGDFADLADLATLSGARGADYVLVNPLHAAEPVPPVQPSPYSPSTRRFFNPLYIRVEAIPEIAYLKPRKRAAVDSLQEQVQALNKDGERLDRNAVYAAKLQALELLYHARRSPARQAAFDEFCRISGSGLDDFALWSAIREDLAPDHPLWADPDCALGSPEAESLRVKLADRIGFHRWLQWICDEQLENAQQVARRAGMRLGVVHDLAVAWTSAAPTPGPSGVSWRPGSAWGRRRTCTTSWARTGTSRRGIRPAWRRPATRRSATCSPPCSGTPAASGWTTCWACSASGGCRPATPRATAPMSRTTTKH
ncbi:4-alpha-glucanotransferase [Arthrobacter sp. Hiyo4]|nr:4-alpha-glucanotransferase [Arthrobacter sp. Hiyo4]